MIWYVATLIASVFSTRGTAAQVAHGVREEPQFVTARAGESVILGCDVSPPLDGQQPPYVVEWFKFGVPIPFFISFRFHPPHVDPEYTGRASLHGKASLQIDPVRSEDQGWYECRVLMLEQQYNTFHNGSWVQLTVNAPPTFTTTPPQYVEAKEGGSTLLTCSAQGNPKPIISWLREGEELAASGKYKVHDGSLTVLGITRDDRGAYTCRAFSDQGEVLHTTRLLVQGPPYIKSPPENITVNISQNARFTCQAEAYPGNLTYTWFWEEDNVYFTKNDLKNRVRILIDGTLHIFRVKPEDAGKYTCSPSNSLGTPPSASAHLSVQYPARVLNMPSIIYVPRKLPGIIRCPADANPPVISVKWEKDGYPLRVEKYPGWSQAPDGSIRVAEATEDSLGTYTCMPYNALGTMGQSDPAILVLKDPPYFNVRPGGEYRQEAGRELVIPCAASGDPEIPTITWRKVGKPSKSKHNILSSGSLQFLSLSKEDHGEWECVATNVVTSITASTRLLVIGTSPHAPGNIRVLPSVTSANVSWEPGYDGGFDQTFSVWYGPVLKKENFGPHDWHSMPVSGSQTWLVVPGLEPRTEYQFSVLAQNKLGTGPFSEVVTVNTVVSPLSTPEPQVLLTPPRCLTANRTQHGVLLTWLPPANHSSPVDRYIMEFRLGERWEVLDDLIPAAETELMARDLVQESWYEFRVMAVMDDLISDSSNVVGVSSTDPFPPTEVTEEGLARPVVAGVVATICFLAAAVLFSTLAACFVNKQHRRKLKRKPDPPLSVTHFRKSIDSPPPLTPLPGVEPCWDAPARSSYMPPPASSLLSSGKISPESSPPASRPQSLSSDGAHGPGLYVRRLPSPQRDKDKELSFYKKTKRAIASKKYSVSKHEAEVTSPIELISRGPDGRFSMASPPSAHRRIQGFPFAEESDMYPEFRQSDEENDFDPGPLPPIMATLRPQLSPTSSSLESTQPPNYSPRLHRPMEGMSFVEGSGHHAAGQAPASLYRDFPQVPFYGYLGSCGESGIPPPFYMPDISPRSSTLSSPPGTADGGPYGYPSIPEEREEMELHHQYTASGHSLPHTHSTPPRSPRSPDSWQPHEFPFLGLEGPRFIYPPHHPLHHHQDLPDPPPYPPLHSLPPSRLHLPSPRLLQLEVPMAPQSRDRPPGPPARRLAMQQAQSLGQLRHTSHGVGVPVLPYPDPAAREGSLSTARSSSPQSWLSPRSGRRTDPSLPPLVLQPSRLSPLSQSPLSTQPGSPDILVRPPPRPSILRTSHSLEMPEITLHPQATVSFSRRSSLATSPTQAQQGSRRPSPSYRPHMSYASTAASYPSQSPSPPLEGRDVFGQWPSQRRTEEEMLPSEPSQLQISASGEPLGASCDPAGSESLQSLLHHCITKAKRVAANTNNNSTSRRRTGVSPSQTQQQSQTPPAHRKRKRQNRKSPYLFLSSLLRRSRRSEEDQAAILASIDSDGPNYGTLH
ncbi:protein turtle homolog B isoform X1 [Salmo salar]|uniref:Protein turtle homolog B isoform X1 n=1 Tax=Salmo salar TaxID=8030 RepID=A0A1S3T154_SALSA|nr:protein turtle homolog B-like isoform X1 [Salmo salar]|eukprot:XP_014070324.1 PREDICTED: protein turtle homolog B-like isoform X1 [Salmo salar]